MKQFKIVFLALLFIAGFLEAQKDASQTISEEEQLKQGIESLFQSIKEKNEKARSLFEEARIRAESLKQEAEEKLAFLDETLARAKLSKAVDQKEIEKALDLQKEAQELFSKYEYSPCLEKVKVALSHVSSGPVVSISVAPQLFVPEEGKLVITPDIFSLNKITSWTMTVRKKEEGEKESFDIARWASGSETVPVIEWDGNVMDEKGKMRAALDSASSYLVDLVVVDAKGQVGRSAQVKFKTDIFTTKTERGLLINISSIRFDYNKADLKPVYQQMVKRVFNFLLAYPEYQIVVEGHSDYTGNASDNQVLSQRRAQAVADYLVALGMGADRIRVSGLGEALPSYLEKRKAALNRRVSFILLKTKDDNAVYDGYIRKIDVKKEIDKEMK
jgi:outer membrane protein OmpA-like peptidoglycan-associated protein